MLTGLHWFQYVSVRTQSGRVTVGDLPAVFVKLKAYTEMFTEDEIKDILGESYKDMDEEIDFESYLRVSL
jgi:plastin-1